LVDPSLKEELSAETELHLTLNQQKEVCCMQQTGGSGVMPDQVSDLSLFWWV
jgi:exosome complex RNA-binding protein Rrp42 (RNase PH superfamily)